MWVNEYLYEEHGKTRANAIIEDIDHRYPFISLFKLLVDLVSPRISAMPPFPGLRRFPDGRDFAQWTGDDSKALMKVIPCCYLIYSLIYHSIL